MASQHIEISASATRMSSELRYFVTLLQQVQDKADQIKAAYDQAAAGGDYAALGTLLGLSAADAETIYNLIGSVQGEVNGAFINQLLSRCG